MPNLRNRSKDFKIDMNHMGTDALKKSHYLAFSSGNDKLVQEIEEILKKRKVDIPVYTSRVTFEPTGQ